MTHNPRIATTHFTATYADGRHGVNRHGQPVPGHEWPLDGLVECRDAFLRLAGLIS